MPASQAKSPTPTTSSLLATLSSSRASKEASTSLTGARTTAPAGTTRPAPARRISLRAGCIPAKMEPGLPASANWRRASAARARWRGHRTIPSSCPRLSSTCRLAHTSSASARRRRTWTELAPRRLSHSPAGVSRQPACRCRRTAGRSTRGPASASRCRRA